MSGYANLDIKPANVMFDTEGKATLVDWGLSAPVPLPTGACDTLPSAIGTPHYMSPEQFRAKVHENTPVFGLGCTLFELFTRETLLVGVCNRTGISGTTASSIGQMLQLADLEAYICAEIDQHFPPAPGEWRGILLRRMLHPDPALRMSLDEAQEFMSHIEQRVPRAALGQRVRSLLSLPPAPGAVSDEFDPPTQRGEE